MGSGSIRGSREVLVILSKKKFFTLIKNRVVCKANKKYNENLIIDFRFWRIISYYSSHFLIMRRCRRRFLFWGLLKFLRGGFEILERRRTCFLCFGFRDIYKLQRFTKTIVKQYKKQKNIYIILIHHFILISQMK